MKKGKLFLGLLTFVALVVGIALGGAKQAAAEKAPAVNSGGLWRQGGDSNNWSSEGVNNYFVPGDGVTVQMGATMTEANGQVFVYFPVPFGGTPLVSFSNLGNADIVILGFSPEGIHFSASADGMPVANSPINWFAWGPPQSLK